jgi:hypothetical protein
VPAAVAATLGLWSPGCGYTAGADVPGCLRHLRRFGNWTVPGGGGITE